MATKVKSLQSVEESLKESAPFAEKDPFDAFEAVDESVANVAAVSTVNPIEQKRRKMIEGVEQQLAMWRDPAYSIERTVYVGGDDGERRHGKKEAFTPKKWWKRWSDKFVVTPRFGVRPLELQPGKKVYAVTSENMETFLNTIIEQVKSGRYDEQLIKLGTRVRKNT